MLFYFISFICSFHAAFYCTKNNQMLPRYSDRNYGYHGTFFMQFEDSKAEWRSLKTKKALEKVLYQQEIKHFYWTFVYMKLYNNSQKLHRVNHYTKWNEIVKHLIKNEGIHSNITVGSPLGRAVWQEKHPEQFYKITEKISTHKNTQAGSWYTQRQLGSPYSIRF